MVEGCPQRCKTASLVSPAETRAQAVSRSARAAKDARITMQNASRMFLRTATSPRIFYPGARRRWRT
jgi:hypothetical protein